MIGLKMMTAGLAAVLLLSSTSAFASTCRDTCNDKHLTCRSVGTSDDQCLAAWHQCKNRCDTPSLQKTSVSQTPAPPPKPTQRKPH